MTMKKEFKFDPENLKELVSQGIRISPHQALDEELAAAAGKKAEGQTESAPPPKSKPQTEPPTRVVRTKRKADSDDELADGYESAYMSRNSFVDRKATYISQDVRLRLLEIMMCARRLDITVGVYIENIVMAHLDSNKEEIDIIENRKKRLKR